MSKTNLIDDLARLSDAARPGPWAAYETVQADNFIVKDGEGLFYGPGPIMGPSYDKTTVAYVVALVNAHRAGLLAALPEEPAADAREALIESATWALIEYDTDTADRGVRDEHYRERRADVERVAPILANLRRPSPPTEEQRAEVITLCGSTKFKDAINVENSRLTQEGNVVISLGLFGHTDLAEYNWDTDATDLKTRLDRLHFQKIRMADRVHVVNVGGYYGESTAREIAYARLLGKPITFMEPVEGDD